MPRPKLVNIDGERNGSYHVLFGMTSKGHHSQFVKKVGLVLATQSLRRIRLEKPELYREYGAVFFGAKSTKSCRCRGAQLFFHRLSVLINHRTLIPVVSAFAFFAFLFGGMSASAYWRQNQDVFQNSAHTLRKGDSLIGLFTPFQYGITDELTVGLHPVLLLLLTPNLHTRTRILTEPITVTLSASYAQTFIEPQSTDVGNAYPGTTEGGILVSLYPNSAITVTPYIGYVVDFATTTSAVDSTTIMGHTSTPGVDFGTRVKTSQVKTHLLDHGFSYGVGLNWLLSSSDMVLLQAKAFVSLVSGAHELPTGIAMWIHSWELVGVGVGAAAGNFVIRTGQNKLIELPVYPIFDFWVAF